MHSSHLFISLLPVAGKLFSADEAFALGVVDEIVKPEKVYNVTVNNIVKHHHADIGFL